MVTRLDAQKGLDIAGHAVHLLLNAIAGEAQFAVLGSGAPEFETMFRHLAAYHTRKMAAVLRYDAALAPLIYAGSDLFLMPSRFEPCGQSQMISMRYGTVPIVRSTGGLADTVIDSDADPDNGNGLSFYDAHPDYLVDAARRAMAAMADGDRWRAIQARGMSEDWSWRGPAREYVAMYRRAIASDA